MHTVVGRNGKERNTTVRDARKFGLLPSVTNVTGIVHKEGVTRWKMDYCVQAALTLPRKEGEGLDAFTDRVVDDAEQAMSAAAEFGSRFHAGAQRVAENPLGLSENEELYEWLVEYRGWMETNIEKVLWTEKVLVNRAGGYGGTADMLCVHRKHGLCLVDLKTQKIAPGRTGRVYPGWKYQLAAYRQVVGREVTCMNLIIDSTRPRIDGEYFHGPEEMDRAWQVFQAAMFIWRHEKDYLPGVIETEGAGGLRGSSDPIHTKRSTPNETEACR